MRATVALLLPLLAVLGCIAWGATEVVQHTTRSWFDRDIRLRAQFAVASAREGLAAAVRKGDRVRARRLLADLAQDERVTAAALCDAGGALLASTARHPEALGCRAVRAQGPGERATSEPWDF